MYLEFAYQFHFRLLNGMEPLFILSIKFGTMFSDVVVDVKRFVNYKRGAYARFINAQCHYNQVTAGLKPLQEPAFVLGGYKALIVPSVSFAVCRFKQSRRE